MRLLQIALPVLTCLAMAYPLNEASAQHPPERSSALTAAVFERANQHYHEGRFSEAIREYNQLISQGLISPTLYFNLGNAHFKRNELGMAVLFYEKARRLDPRSEDILSNLRYCRERCVDLVPDEQARLEEVVELWLSAFTLRKAFWVFAAFWLLMWSMVALRIAGTRRALQRLALVVCAACLATSVVFGTTAWAKYSRITSKNEAVVLTEKVDLRSGPGPQYTPVALVHEGLKVEIRSTHEVWSKITLPNGIVGWVMSEDIGVI